MKEQRDCVRTRALGRIPALLCSVFYLTDAFADTTLLDLSPVANTSLENDGEHGWSEEGINDMYLYPPVPTGEFTRNGYSFRIIPKQQEGGKSVLMLKGRNLQDKPEEATLPVPRAKGKFIYFLQNYVHAVPAPSENYQLATYVVTYADGSQQQIPIRDGIEIMKWWTGQWFQNAGASAWPIIMGKNAISSKWNQYVGVWAMQWTNPTPDKPITSITFRSAGQASPAIFAVTISDEDFHKSPDVKADYKRPGDAPADYYRPKLAIIQERIFAEMRKNGMAKGVRSVDVIRPDVLAVTIDAVIARGPDMANDEAARLQQPGAFEIASDRDPAYQQPANPIRVGRLSYEYWNGDVGAFEQNRFYWHTYYLFLPKPLTSGQSYRITAKALPAEFTTQLPLDYADNQTVTPAIKVNQVAYAAQAAHRYAYLGFWAGDAGAINYPDARTFRVINESNNSLALEGPITVREASDPLSGEEVHQLDLSPLKPGKYHIVVPGLARSDSFHVGGEGIRDLFFHTSRAFYHQRCGHELAAPYTDFHKPACHLEVYESGYLVGNPRYSPKPDEPVRKFRGGYHDAADFDVFTYHLRATAQVLAILEAMPDKFTDNQLNIPESGNSIPDILDEADWALFSYRDNQQPDGGVPYGRGNDEDAIRDWERSHNGQRPPFALFPPNATYNYEYVAVAAQYARLIRKYDAARADAYLDSARRAYAWSKTHPETANEDRGGDLFALWAAAELFSTTGDPAIHDDFKKLYNAGVTKKINWKHYQWVPICFWPYAATTQPTVDKTIQNDIRADIIKSADHIARDTDAPAYRVGRGKADKGNGWGNLNGGGRWADPAIRAYLLTKEARYLDTIALNADFQLGANPLSKTFITGMGARHPLHPQISDFLYTGPGKTGSTVKGITVYGLATVDLAWYPEIPSWRKHRDLGNGGAEICSEFTITETIGASGMLYSFLYALDNQ